MAWIAMYDSVYGPKLRELEDLLGCSEAEALGILVILWHWGLNNADEDGKLLSASERHVRRELYDKTSCDLKEVVESLFKAGWLDKEGNDIFIHDFGFWQEPWFKYKKKQEADKEYQKKRRNVAPEDQMTMELEPGEETGKGESKPRDKKYPASFDEIWKIYPRKIEKKAAYKNYLTRLKEGWKTEELLEATKNYAIAMSGKDESFIKHGSTFFGPSTPFTDYLPKRIEEKPEAEHKNPFWEYGDTG